MARGTGPIPSTDGRPDICCRDQDGTSLARIGFELIEVI
jgi:hypothetical protein